MLKKLSLILALVPQSLLAASPLLTKVQNSGFTPPAYAQSFVCQIFNDHVVIRRTFGSVQTEESRQVTISPDVQSLIVGSKAEVFEEAATLCDAPGTSISADLRGDNILLLAKSTCSRDGARKGTQSTILINLANGLCGAMR